MAMNPAQRAYTRRFIPTAAAYVIVLVAVSFLLRGAGSGPAAYALAVLPALPVIAIFWIIGRYLVEEQDEYLRMLMVRQSLLATGITMSAATLWGFLEALARAPHVELYWVAIFWFFAWGIAGLAISLRK